MRKLSALIVICITAILAIALCSCDDLGAFGDSEEYYDSFDDIVLIDGISKESQEYSVEKYFYNDESREDFLQGENGVYKGVTHGKYVYMAIPFESNIDMDTLALYFQSTDDVALFINVYVTDTIPENWRSIADNVIDEESSDETQGSGSADNTDDGSENDSPDESGDNTDEGSEGNSGNTSGDNTSDGSEKPTYDDPDPETRIGEIVIHLKKDNWDSFVLETFYVNGAVRESIQINDGQYILLQFRNNSGVRVFDEEKQVFVDPQSGMELAPANITMTNLLVRALSKYDENETQGGE